MEQFRTMDKTANFILDKYSFSLDARMPLEIPNVDRETLAKWFCELGFNYGVEVGVAAGEYSEIIMKANPNLRLTGVDSWAPYKGYRDYQKESTLQLLEEQARERLEPYENYVFMKAFSMEAKELFNDNSLDFVYLDANHHNPFVTQDIEEWYKKVRPGGILAGHDYVKSRNVRVDVVEAVNKFTEKNDIDVWFVLGEFKHKKGELRDSARSWLIVKE